MIEGPESRKPLRKLETLEVVRAFAALAVVAFHASEQPHLKGLSAESHPVLAYGRFGVQIFFVLSGFIILFIHGKEIGLPDRVPRYFYRRWLRIWPIYAALTILQVLAKFLLPGREADSLVQVMTSLFFLDLENTPVVNVGWTLVHEAFFYLVFGVIMALGVRFAGWFLVGFTMVMAAYHFDSSLANPLVAFTFSHMKWYFLSGIAVACLVPSAFTGLLPSARGLGFFLMSFMAVVGILGVIMPDFGRGSGQTLFRAVGIGLLLLLLVILDLHKRFKMPKLLVYLGAASYSIYLVHSTVMDLGLVVLQKAMPGLLATHLGPTMTVLALLSIFCGCLCHEILEKPLIRWIRGRSAQNV